ncbi:MAG: SAM-dependent chlorinase/fluorinase, partial [Proteobacteria bacterium]|nr:SAM-dependent chlorinase/fluorinase [Pseudomonadota bacterium]
DVYSPVAAHLAKGDHLVDVGPQVGDVVRLSNPQPTLEPDGIHGLVVALDGPFGNLVTNVDRELLAGLGYRLGDIVRVRVGEAVFEVPYAATFGAVEVGRALLFVDSRGLVSLAINQGNFAREHAIVPPAPLLISRPAVR